MLPPRKLPCVAIFLKSQSPPTTTKGNYVRFKSSIQICKLFKYISYILGMFGLGFKTQEILIISQISI